MTNLSPELFCNGTVEPRLIVCVLHFAVRFDLA
jgi:hypothetical protein